MRVPLRGSVGVPLRGSVGVPLRGEIEDLAVTQGAE